MKMKNQKDQNELSKCILEMESEKQRLDLDRRTEKGILGLHRLFKKN